MSPLIHLIYSSAATRPFQDDELVELLAHSRAKNARCGITGMLLYDNGSFFQILEGSSEAVDQLYQSIAQDERHTKAVVIIRERKCPRVYPGLIARIVVDGTSAS
ncbi:MAG: BLUF domain-containing protein, partial [Cyanobacteria bacterium]|nr:BLUF domain-containing protein [Cyanobacteriota bacterium]